MEDEFIKKLRERYENGYISRETYEDILERYLKDKDEENSEKDDKDFSMDETIEKIDYAMKKMDEKLKKGLEKIDLNSGYGESKRDYKCAGSCILGPGVYGHISAAGSIKITGNIRAEKISVSGALSADGDIKADGFKSSGGAKIHGNLIVDNISASGMLVAKHIKGENIRIGGIVSCEELEGEDISVGGSVNANKIKAENLKIKIDGRCRVDDIEGEDIEIKAKKGLFRQFKGKLKAKKISGERVYLECVTAKEVRGEDVMVGDNCQIGVVIAENIDVSKNAKVGRVIRK